MAEPTSGEYVLRLPARTMEDIERESWVTRAIAFAWNNIAFYRQLWSKDGHTRPPSLSECRLWSVDDIRRDQHEHPPFGTLYADIGLADVRWLVTSSGTTGVPRITPQCASDLPTLRSTYRRFFEFAGVKPKDVVTNTFTYGPLAACWSTTRACEEIGATLLPASSGRTTPPQRLLTLIEHIGVTVVIGMPSYLLQVGELAAAEGVDLSNLSPRLLMLSGEGATSETRQTLCDLWGAETRSFYGSSDVDWIAIECEESAQRMGELGAHIYPDQCMVEVVDENGQRLSESEEGELVVTSWTRPSSPRIRYRTGDRSRLTTEPCECGRLSPRVLPITGRTDRAIRYHGVTVRPNEIEKLLRALAARSVEFQLSVQRHADDENKESLLIELECGPDELRRWNTERIESEMQKQLGVRPRVRLVPTATFVGSDDATPHV